MNISLSAILENTRVTTVKDNDPAIATPPLTGGSIIIDPNLDLYQQVTDYFKELGYEVPNPSMRTEVVSNQFDNIMQQAKELLRELKATDDKAQRVLLSLSDELATSTSGMAGTRSIEDGRPHISKIGGLIDKIHTGYQKDFGEIIKKSTDFMKAINGTLGEFSGAMRTVKDGKITIVKLDFLYKMEVHFFSFTQGGRKSWPKSGASDGDKNNFIADWLKDLAEAKPIAEIDYSTSAFSFWQKKLDGQGFIVKKSANNNKILIQPDLKPIREMISIVANADNNKWYDSGSDLSPQAVQALQTALDSQKNAVQGSVTRVLETFRQDNSHFDTLTQLLVQLIKDLNQYNNGFVNM